MRMKDQSLQTGILFCSGVNVHTLFLSFCNVTKIKTIDWNSLTSKQVYKCHVIFYYSDCLLYEFFYYSAVNCRHGELSPRWTVAAVNCRRGELSPRWTVSAVNCRRGELSPRWKDARGELSTAMKRPRSFQLPGEVLYSKLKINIRFQILIWILITSEC